jgi:hypothetical protein
MTTMEQPLHTFSQLFAQLGLPSDAAGIEQFITKNAPLPDHVSLAEAPFWTPAQAAFLHEEWRRDADWAEVIDELNVRMHG